MEDTQRELRFITITPQSSMQIGWRYNDAFNPDVREVVSNYLFAETDADFSVSSARFVQIKPFEIAAEAFSWSEISSLSPAQINDVESLTHFCRILDCDLQQRGLRLPTEDEFEIACGGSLFPWGDEIPTGAPYQGMTGFEKHLQASEHGLKLNSNTYLTEVTHTALKLGDGGVSLCGGYEWPIPWLSFCPAFRVPQSMLDDCLAEFLDDTLVRPIKL